MSAANVPLNGDALLVAVTDAIGHVARALPPSGARHSQNCAARQRPDCVRARWRIHTDVLAFISNHSVGPDMEIELFMLTPDPNKTIDSSVAPT
jgi:hypothetical protein